MTSPKDVYLAARELVGTPYLHQGRHKRMGVDCIGVPILTANCLGLGNFDVSGYGRTPDGTLIKRIAEVFPPFVLQPGVLLVFKIRSVPQHCGIVSRYMDGLGLIHAWDVADKVVEHRLTQGWLNKVVGCYGFPGVIYGTEHT